MFVEKYIKVEHKSQTSIKTFVDELDSMKMYDKLNQNINRFANLVNSAREKHLPTKIVKKIRKNTKNHVG